MESALRSRSEGSGNPAMRSQHVVEKVLACARPPWRGAAATD
ncbi:hypothetical protein MGWOODY_Smn828 [hydrothermal vent metagenome]|uniref:Uncharacterized protein n=1 Tax=hydrothermal vent metagenome TaxID=652676 RepID=A0A160TEY4_9ZZZZ